MDETFNPNNNITPQTETPAPESPAVELPMAEPSVVEPQEAKEGCPAECQQEIDDRPIGDHPRSLCANCRDNKKLMVYDWMRHAPEANAECDFVEVQFKNTRKGYYLNQNHLKLHKGDIVAVEGNPGHDIGEVTLTGHLVSLQIKKMNVRFDDRDPIRKVFRIAKPSDMERYHEAKAKEHDTMLRSRKIAEDLHLEMKIGDVEYQGDGNKAIFYYIADGRVDFRQLIKVLADVFKVRIEMKQIGARQEAGRIGGIGPCGRELCCAGWHTKFMSVGTAAARFQDLSMNPQKLAGQCAKLKCCLNYEVDCYMEANREIPQKDIVLQTQDQDYYFFKADILSRSVTYSTSKDGPFNLVTISSSRAWEIINMNKRGHKPEKLSLSEDEKESLPEFTDGVGDEDLTRFDRRKKNKKNRGDRHRDNKENRNDETPKEGKRSNDRPKEPRNADRPNEGKRGNDRHRDNRSGDRSKGERHSRERHEHPDNKGK